MKKELSVSIDEITLVLLLAKESSTLDWNKNRKNMIQIFLDKSKLGELYGKIVQADKCLQPGYTYSQIFPDKPFHFCISWHETFDNMGICIISLHWHGLCTKQIFLENITKGKRC